MQRTPIYFQGCFGWIHEADKRAHTSAQVGAVLLSAFGQEEICTHYGMAALADELAGRGMPTVRFDYEGTGDSVGGEINLQRFAADAKRAVALLRQECGVGTVVLAGLRLGAAVALQAAEQIPDLGGLVLMAPVLSGTAFLRETRAAAKMNQLSNLDPVPNLESDMPLNTNGFHWPKSFQHEVVALDASKLAAPTVPTLMMAARGDRRPAKLAAGWNAAGGAITEQSFTEYEAWMQDPTTSTVPAQTFRDIGQWIAGLALAQTNRREFAPVRVTRTLESDGFVEEPWQFGHRQQVFGVLCRPSHPKPAAEVVALLLHEGSSHHIGDGGAYVTLARRLAQAGIASLRMDLTGMGDSPAGDNLRHPHYDPERIPEALAGLDVLERAGFHKAVAFGLCSGAYTALQVSLADPRVVGNVLVNLQKFVWHYGDDIRVANRSNKRSIKGYARAMRNSDEWKRVFAGKADLPGTARVLVKRALAGAFHHVRNLMPLDPNSEAARVHREMRELADRSVHTNLIYSDDDPGLSDLSKQFGRGGRRLGAFASTRLQLLSHADHHFNGSSVRRRYTELSVKLMKAAVAEHAPKPAGDNARRSAAGTFAIARM